MKKRRLTLDASVLRSLTPEQTTRVAGGGCTNGSTCGPTELCVPPWSQREGGSCFGTCGGTCFDSCDPACDTATCPPASVSDCPNSCECG